MKSLPFLFCAAEREGEILIPNGNFVPQKGDRLYIIGSPVGIQQYFKHLGRHTQKIQSVFLVGGSRIAHYLADMLLQMRMSVTIVENKLERCRFLSEHLPEALILQGDGTDPELLKSEHFTQNDAFVSLTGRDEDNLLICLYAQQQGLKKVIAKCNRDNYFSIVHSAGLESVVSPKLITVGRILRVVRGLQNKKGSVMISLHRFSDYDAEAAEFEINSTASHLGVPLKDLRLRPGILIAAILHRGKVSIPNGKSIICAGDRVLIVSHAELIQDFNDIFREE